MYPKYPKILHSMKIFLILCVLLFVNIVENVEQDIIPLTFLNEGMIYNFFGDDIFFEILYPEDLRYTYRLRQAKDFGTRFKNTLIGVRLVAADPIECCSLPYNQNSIEGAVTLVARGGCSFVNKAVKAEEAGAVAVIVSDSDAENDDLYIEMIDDQTNRKPNIPAAFLLGKSGYMIRRSLMSKGEEAAIINIPVNITSKPLNKIKQPPWILW